LFFLCSNKEPGREFSVIRSAEELKVGDHVSVPMKGMGMFQHHAIVADVTDDNVTFCHANPDIEERKGDTEEKRFFSGFGSATVGEQKYDLKEALEKGHVRRYKYEKNECREPLDVVDRCRSKKGLFHYHLYDNNCEHLARWCKTGIKISYQAEDEIAVKPSKEPIKGQN